MFDVICDRDGVLNVDVGYTHSIEDFAFPEGAVAGLTILRDAGARFCIVTGQSGIAQGMYTEDHMHEFNLHIQDEYRRHGIEFAAIVFCPHYPAVLDCNCRKPKTGMLDQIEAKIGPINWESAWGVGDKPSDSEMILSKGGRAVLLSDMRYWSEDDPKLAPLLNNPRHFVANNVLEAANLIIP